ncbi:ABC exporter membrane fusion protein [Gloeothece verrucosa]|uniref:ABC exporter membrane fusion protein, DevB family n=1 Tax=Gloeothece verrucosa (strain PCC 7822) TaxID=497965 RepID=E0UL54_GLOV7|nr:ABC exporter membrane fusion protein [Gloeothece verrucosa]ADN17684.1 ABC exporter membrane fusion protein, DevB family [Gloeothece verrucosa PCC 7822]
MVKSQFFVKPTGWITTVALLTATLCTGAVTTYTLLQYKAPRKTVVAAPSVTSTPIPKIAALGYLEPRGEVIKLSAPALMEGTRVDQLLVKRGDLVKKGQVIAILDNYARLQAALTQAQAQVEIAQSRLAQTKAGAKKGEIAAQDARFEGSSAELQGQIAIQKATIASLEAQLKGEKSAQEATIERTKAQLINADTDCKRYKMLFEDGAVSEQERDRFCLQADTALATYTEAQANLERITTTLEEKITEAKANLQRTVLTLNKKIKENQATLSAVEEVRPVDVKVAQSELISAQANVKKAKADLDLAYVRASRDGQILKIHIWPGELVSNEGIVELGQTSQMYVRAEVYETDIYRVHLGQKATIKSNGVVGILNGVVDEIGLQIGKKNVFGTDPVEDADARVVEVKIRLSPESSQKVAGLTNLQVNVIINASDVKKGV